ncbi:MAG TPA: peptidoglycan recognition family protein [Thermodesulfobacteriota bacterium]|nr:peptidoglycan recognition family protein [Thermodesulfobacteriota bacterium]
MPVSVAIPSLGSKFQDYRDPIPGDSYNWGPTINANNIIYFTFHHSVTKQTAKVDGNWKKECDTIANLHINQGWGGVGYRFIICSDGTVAYVGDLSHGGSAVLNKNDIMFSACFVGDFTKELPTAIQVHSSHLLAKHFITNMPQYPKLDSWDDIKGHKNFMATACPGSNWDTGGDTLRDRIVNDRWDGYPDPKLAISTPTPPPPPPTPSEDYKAKYTALLSEFETYKKTSDKEISDKAKKIIELQGKIEKATIALS